MSALSFPSLGPAPLSNTAKFLLAEFLFIAFNALENSEFWFDDMSDIYVVEMPARQTRKEKMNTFVTDLNGFIHIARRTRCTAARARLSSRR